MEKFMFLFHGGMSSSDQLSPEAMQQNMGKWMAWIEQLSKAGKYVAGEPLMPGGKSIGGKDRVITDGPFAEGKEVVGGFFIVNAENYEEALAIAQDYPDFELDGKVQIRQVMKM